MNTKLIRVSTKDLGILLAIMLGSFSFLTYKVLDEDTIKFDTGLNQLIHTTRSQDSTKYMHSVSDLGQIGGIVFALFLSGVLVYKNKFSTAINLLSTVFGAVFLTEFLKLIFNRNRPEILNRLATEYTFSFPSGHATASFVLFPILAILFYDNVDIPTEYKRVVVFLLCIFPFIVGYSRLYLGVHYFTDIVAGAMIGLSFASIFYYTYTNTKK